MIDAGIHDNDVVVVDRDTRPVEGHIVIAIVDGGFVCRQLCRRRGDLSLEARNAQQIYAPTPVEGVEIWGVVRTGVREYRCHRRIMGNRPTSQIVPYHAPLVQTCPSPSASTKHAN